MSYRPRSSVPVEVFEFLLDRLAHLAPAPRTRGGTRPLSLEVRLDAVCAVICDGVSYRRAGRVVGISKTEVGDSMHLLLSEVAAIGICRPDGSFVTTIEDLTGVLGEMNEHDEPVAIDGFATRIPRPGSSWAAQYEVYDAKNHFHAALGAVCCDLSGDLLWVDGGWPGRCHEQDVLDHSGIAQAVEASGVFALVDRGYRGWASRAERVAAPVGTKATKHRLSDADKDYNALHSKLRACVERAVAHVTNAWALRRWRGRLARLRQVIRAAGTLTTLSRWVKRVPT